MAFAHPSIAVADGPSRPGDTQAMQLILRFLRQGLSALDVDRSAARASMQAARDLVQAELHRGLPEEFAGGRAASGGLAPWQARAVVSHIRANIDGVLTAERLAAATRLKPSYFPRAFKATFGVTPHAFVLKERLSHAQELMLRTREPLCTIALACGFTDQPHFTRCFRSDIGVTPHAWRRDRSETELIAALQ